MSSIGATAGGLLGATMGEKVTAKQLIAIETLVVTGQVTDAAKAAQVAPKTVHAWRKQPAFQEALRQAELEALQAFSSGLVSLSQSTMQALKDGLSPAEPMATRLRAAALVVDGLLRVRELVDLESRVKDLENANQSTSQAA